MRKVILLAAAAAGAALVAAGITLVTGSLPPEVVASISAVVVSIVREIIGD